MRDALPSIQDVRRIFFKQQRKKNLIPEHANLTNEYNQEIYRLRRKLSTSSNGQLSEADQKTLDKFIELKTEVENKHFEDLREKLIDHIVCQPRKLRLARIKNPERKLYSINKRRIIPTLHDRYVSMVISRAFRLKTLGRDQAIRVLIDSLNIAKGGKAAYRAILKFDIESFFDNVRHDEIKRKITSHPGVPRFVVEHLDSIFSALSRMDPQLQIDPRGIPQGVPSSSVISEVYLENLDIRLRQHPSVILYLRYVDDIIVICDESDTTNISNLVEKELANVGLKVNSSKEVKIVHPATVETSFEYLGYKVIFENESSQLKYIDISEAKKDRYLKALDKVSKYAITMTCWADEQSVDTFLWLFEYLLLTHATEESVDVPRIVTGLGYNARFVTSKNTGNLNEVIRESKKILWKSVGKIINSKLNPQICNCCNRNIYRVKDISNLVGKVNFNGIMYSSALLHIDDVSRERVRKLLWES